MWFPLLVLSTMFLVTAAVGARRLLDADDARDVARYQRQRRAFEDLFE